MATKKADLSAVDSAKLRKAQVQQLKIVELEVKAARGLISAGANPSVASLLSASEKLAGIAQFFNAEGAGR